MYVYISYTAPISSSNHPIGGILNHGRPAKEEDNAVVVGGAGVFSGNHGWRGRGETPESGCAVAAPQ